MANTLVQATILPSSECTKSLPMVYTEPFFNRVPFFMEGPYFFLGK